MFYYVSKHRVAEFVALGVPTQMRIYDMIAQIRSQQKKYESIDEESLKHYIKNRKEALSNKVEVNFWFRPLMRNTLVDQVSNRNVLITGQKINLSESAVIGAGGFSKIYKHQLNSSLQAVKVINITGDFGEIYDKGVTRTCLLEGQAVKHHRIF